MLMPMKMSSIQLKTLQENKDNNVPMTSEQQELLDEYEISKVSITIFWLQNAAL